MSSDAIRNIYLNRPPHKVEALHWQFWARRYNYILIVEFSKWNNWLPSVDATVTALVTVG